MSRHVSGDWSYEDDPPRMGERLTIARLEWCLDTLSSLGCAPHPRSRVPESLRYIKNLDAVDLTEGSVRALVAEIQRLAWELMIILIAAAEAPRRSTPFTREKLNELLGGGLADDDSHARNIQFELHTIALFALGGFQIRRGNPDAQVRSFSEWVGIEAKRLRTTNPDTIRGQLSQASRQIGGREKSGIIQVVRARGLIAVSLEGIFESVDPNVSSEELIREFEGKLQILDRETRVLANRPAVLGLLAYAHVPRWTQATNAAHWQIDTIFPLRWVGVHGEDAADIALAREFGTQIDRIHMRALDLRTRVPKKLVGPVDPAP